MEALKTGLPFVSFLNIFLQSNNALLQNYFHF